MILLLLFMKREQYIYVCPFCYWHTFKGYRCAVFRKIGYSVESAELFILCITVLLAMK